MTMKRTFSIAVVMLLVFVLSVSGTAKKEEAPKALTFTCMAAGTYDKAAEDIKPEFEKETGIQVTIAAFPWATLRQNNTTDLLTGTGKYDVMSGSYYLADVYEHFISLDDYISESGFGKGLLTGFMDKCEHFDGHQIGLPYGPDSYGVLYRKDVFDKEGLRWPSTWDEFISMLPKMESAADANGMDTIVFSGGAPEQAPALFFDKFDGYFITRDGKYQLERDKAIKVLKMDKELLRYMASDFMGLSIDDANARFLDGRALMIICWPSFIVAAADNPEKSRVVGKWALGKSPTPGRPWLSLWQMYISKYSKNPDAAWKWCMAYINEENDVAFFKKYGIGPVFQSTYDNPELKRENAHYFPAQSYNLTRAVNPPLSGEAQDYFASVLGEFGLGELSAEEVVDKVNQKWASIPVPPALLENAKLTGQVQK
jgi:ABC-type glycerol-3-phosphate transport system substrate-binding protein